jgi:hypothetical protein
MRSLLAWRPKALYLWSGLVALFVIVIWLSAPNEANQCPLLYKDEFESSPPDWLTVPAQRSDDGIEIEDPPLVPMTREHENGNSYLSSTGPWWFDRNHQFQRPPTGTRSTPAVGAVHLVAVIYSGMWGIYDTQQKSGNPLPLRPEEILSLAPRFALKLGQRLIPEGQVNGLLAAGTIHGPDALSPLDLRNAQLSFKLRTNHLYLPPHAHLQFWFQTYDRRASRSGRMVNYIRHVDLEHGLRDGEWKTVRVSFNAKDGTWMCMGSNYRRAATYGCSRNVATALSTFNTDMGLLIFLGNSPSDIPATGKIDIDDVELRLCN